MSGKCKLEHILLENASIELNLLDSSDEEETDQVLDDIVDDLSIVSLFRYSFQTKVPKNINWFEEVLWNYDDDRLRRLIRCNREQFNIILGLIRNHKFFNGFNSQKQFSPCFQLALVLYRLGSNGDGGTSDKIAALFGVGDGGTIGRVTSRVFKSIISLEDEFMTWPSADKRETFVCETFGELPYCVGYADGTEIPLVDAPVTDPQSYYSRNKKYSIKLQAVCDFQLKIRHIVVGWPGSVHDARIFNNCDLALYPSEYFTEPQWIAADSAYKLTTTMITPFRSNSTISTAAMRKGFNRYFSSYRVRIEHCFALLKQKLSSLKQLSIRISDEKSCRLACNWIRVCCILHNILLPYYDEEDLRLDPMENNELNETEQFGNSVLSSAEMKRLALLEVLLERQNS